MTTARSIRDTAQSRIHLWGCASTASPVTEASLEWAMYLGPLSAAWLAKAFSTHADPPLTRFTFTARRTQRVAPLDTIACDKTPVIGMLKSLAQELAWLRCRHVDLDVDLDREGGGGAAARCCIEEARVLQQDVEVAYRNGSRFVAALERVAFADGASGQPPFARGATPTSSPAAPAASAA